MKISWRNNIKVVVGIEFGTFYSHKSSLEIITHDMEYDEKYEKVLNWGYPALAKKPSRISKKLANKPA
ncbi:hypothetical protein Glove_109g156 [Diversispora epigaea]|uniref:Uncharacterized protein n=1 Tax=Diversispora epigaea TaxID=1348612 RepID=A0A397J8Y1_9GLOM|nr:hypothetical protein Glove_109g156 [Diversispora epigaea]